jgi:hypothetical protein
MHRTEDVDVVVAGDRATIADAPSRRQAVAAGVLLLLFVALLHYDVIFLGRSLVQTNYFNPLDHRGLSQNYGDDLVPHTAWTDRNLWFTANIRDPATSWWQWEPSTQFLKEAIAKREWPFWDPYIGAGSPSMANLLPAFFFPPYTLTVALGGSVGLRNAYFLFLLWGAGFCSYLFLRQHRLGFFASVGGAAAIVTGGAMNQYVGSIAGQTASCLPAALVATRWLLDAPAPRRIAIAGVVYAAILLSSLPPVLVGLFAMVALYAIVAIALADCGATRIRAAIASTAAFALSIGLVGFYYAPAIALSRAVPHVADLYRGSGLEAMPVLNILQLFSPTLLGGVRVYVTAPFATDGYAAHIPYVGVACVLAALLSRAGSDRRERTLISFTAIAIVLILLKLFGVPPVQWIGHLPVFEGIHFAHYLGVFLGFLLAFLAALGLDHLLRGSISTRRIVVAGIVGAAATSAILGVAASDGAFAKDGSEYWIRDWVVLAAATVTAIVLGAAYALGRERSSIRTAVAASFVALIAIEGVYNNLHPKPASWDMFEHPLPFLRLIRLEAPMGRILGFGIPPANVNGAYRVYGLNSLMTFTPPRVYELYRRYGESAASVFMTLPSTVPPERVLDHAHVRFLSAYVAVPEDVQRLEARGYLKKFDDGFVALFERTCAPRFYFSSEYRVVSTAGALDAIASAPPREVVVEERPSTPHAPNAPDDPGVAIESYRFNSMRLTVDAPRPGLVYASESFFDGWTATVNGLPAPILPANYAFRAVEVPAGRATVEFRYQPPGLTAGLCVTATSIVIALALLVAPSPRQRTRPATGDPTRDHPTPAET